MDLREGDVLRFYAVWLNMDFVFNGNFIASGYFYEDLNFTINNNGFFMGVNEDIMFSIGVYIYMVTGQYL